MSRPGRTPTPGRRAATAGGQARGAPANRPTSSKKSVYAARSAGSAHGSSPAQGRNGLRRPIAQISTRVVGRALGAACVKPERVGDDERVGRDRDCLRRRQAERGECLRRDRAHQLVRVLRRPAAGRDRHPPLPVEALRRQNVRPRHVDERHRIRRDIGQEQPSLDRRVECVRMEIGLRIGRPGDGRR